MKPKLPYRAVALFLTAVTLHAQSFEVVSIKPNNTGSSSSGETTRPGKVTGTNVTIGMIFADPRTW